jgi:hypothetical protein
LEGNILTVTGSITESDTDQRRRLEKIATKMGLEVSRDWQQWYNVDIEEFTARSGSIIINIHGSLPQALMALYPDYAWNSFAFKYLQPNGTRLESPQQYIAWISKRCKVSTLDDWYTVPLATVERHESTRLAILGGSLLTLLLETYPNHPWNLLKFAQIPKSFWYNNISNQRMFWTQFAEAMSILLQLNVLYIVRYFFCHRLVQSDSKRSSTAWRLHICSRLL